jgi:glycosyltransferase involved in cell wall biosynthesis
MRCRDIHALGRSMMNKGHEVRVITLNDWKGFCGNEIYNGIKTYTISAVTLPYVRYPIPNMVGLFHLIKKMGDSFDIIHFFQQEYLTIIPSFFFEGFVKVLTVDNFPGVDWSYGKKLIDTFARLESITIGRKSIKHFDGIIFWSKLSLRTALTLEPRAKRVVWIPDGVDTKRIKPNKKTRDKVREDLKIDGIAVAFVGRLVPVKGIVYLAEAIRILDTEGFKGHFIIVGDGPEKDKLEALRLSNSKIHFLGFRRDPTKYLQAADLLVLPSLGEGCPNVVLEAFACGKPVVASGVGGVPDLVQNGVNGMIVPVKDPVELAKTISIMASDSKKLKKMGMRAREFAEKELDWGITTDRVIQFYYELLKN